MYQSPPPAPKQSLAQQRLVLLGVGFGIAVAGAASRIVQIEWLQPLLPTVIGVSIINILGWQYRRRLPDAVPASPLRVAGSILGWIALFLGCGLMLYLLRDNQQLGIYGLLAIIAVVWLIQRAWRQVRSGGGGAQ